MPVTIDGLVSGIDTESVVQGLLEIQQQQLDRMTLRQSEVQDKQAVFRSLEAQLLTLRTSLGKLGRVQGNPIAKLTVTASNEDAMSATATEAAQPGTYNLRVDTTAKSHKVATQGFADSDALITQGTFDLRVGAGEITTITIDASNNTVQGLADAINAAGAGATASILQDASNPSAPYRLLLSSNSTGTVQQITLTNNLAASTGTETQPAFDFGTPVQAATDAQVTIGEGAGAIAVSSHNNRFNDVITGVSFNLLQVSPGEEISLTVGRDVKGAADAVSEMVDSFNKVVEFIQDRSKYNVDAASAGPLLGNRTAILIQQALQTAAIGVVPGVNSKSNRLASVGISVTDQGKLTLNRSKLEQALAGEIEGVDTKDMRRLFALDATTTNNGVSFVLGTAKTKATTDPIQVDITQAAKRATITAGTPLAASTVITAANKSFSITLDGGTADLTLAEGTYDRQQLADHLEAVINASPELIGSSVKVGLTSDALTITSDSYGTTSSIVVAGGTSLTDLGIFTGAAGVGQDVAGTFIVNGQTEPATGRGRLLSGNSDNATTADLQLRITLAPSQVTAGVEAEVNVTRGLASTLDSILEGMLHPETGQLATIDDRYDAEIESMKVAFERQQALFDKQRDSIIRQFVAVESALSDLQTTSSFLESQLASLSGFNSKKK